ARAESGPPGHDRVEPARARVAADDVRRSTQRGRSLIGASRGEAPDGRRRSSPGADAEDSVELRDPVAAADEVDRAAEVDGSRIVQRPGKASRGGVAGGRDEA